MAGLPANKAIVSVGPPLSFNPLGSSLGSIGDPLVPTMSLFPFGFPAGKLTAAPSFFPIRLKPCDGNIPETSGPDKAVEFEAIRVLLITNNVPPLLKRPPPLEE